MPHTTNHILHTTKLVLIDGNAILHRAFHALPKTFTDGKGNLTNAVYGFASMVLRIIEDLKPTHIAICFDRKEPTFRKIEFEDYQAHRPETDKGLSSQFPLAREVAKGMSIPVYEKKGFEADDLIGTLAVQVTKIPKLKSQKSNKLKIENSKLKIERVVIVTGDKDILQLVNDKKGVEVYMPIKGLSVAKILNEKDVREKMGVSASQIIDYKGLVGDPSDNYKGVPGIGPKTAEKLLKTYGSFPEIYKNLKKIDEKVALKLKEHKKSAEMSYKLAKIVTNVKFKYSLDEMKAWDVGGIRAIKVFDKFNFRSVKVRAKNLSEKLKKEAQLELL